MDEGKGPNPYFEGLHEGESDELRALRLALDELRGNNLACWCKVGTPCHADVLLRLANEGTP